MPRYRDIVGARIPVLYLAKDSVSLSKTVDNRAGGPVQDCPTCELILTASSFNPPHPFRCVCNGRPNNGFSSEAWRGTERQRHKGPIRKQNGDDGKLAEFIYRIFPYERNAVEPSNLVRLSPLRKESRKPPHFQHGQAAVEPQEQWQSGAHRRIQSRPKSALHECLEIVQAPDGLGLRQEAWRIKPPTRPPGLAAG